MAVKSYFIMILLHYESLFAIKKSLTAKAVRDVKNVLPP
jgi:hypothetical protein